MPTEQADIDTLARQLVGEFEDWDAATVALYSMAPAERQPIYAAARALAEEQLKSAIRTGIPGNVIEALRQVTQVAAKQHDVDTVRAYVAEEIDWRRRFQDLDSLHLQIAAGCLQESGSASAARPYAEWAVDFARKQRIEGLTAMALFRCALVYGALGRVKAARSSFAESIVSHEAYQQRHPHTDMSGHLVMAYAELAKLDIEKQCYGDVVEYLSAIHSICESRQRDDCDSSEYIEMKAKAQGAVSEEEFARRWQSGRTLTPEMVVKRIGI